MTNIIRLTIAVIMALSSLTAAYASDCHYSPATEKSASQLSTQNEQKRFQEKLALIRGNILRLERYTGTHEANQILDDTRSMLNKLETQLAHMAPPDKQKVFFDPSKKVGDKWTDIFGFQHQKYRDDSETVDAFGKTRILGAEEQWLESDGNLRRKTSDGLTHWRDDDGNIYWIGSNGHEYSLSEEKYSELFKEGLKAKDGKVVKYNINYELVDQDETPVNWDILSQRDYLVK